MKTPTQKILAITTATFFVVSPFLAAAETKLDLHDRLENRIHNLQVGLDSFMPKAHGEADVRHDSDIHISKDQSSVRTHNSVRAGILLAKGGDSDDGDKKDKDKDDKKDKDTNDTDDGDKKDKDLPKGIIKRLENGKDLPKGFMTNIFKEDSDTNGTTTPKDTAAPMVFGIRTNAGTSTAEVRFLTSERASAKIRYGTTVALGTELVMNADLAFKHHISLMNLLPDTLYQYAFVVTDASGNVRETALASFRTDPIVPPQPDIIAPRIVFAVVTKIDHDSAKIIWVTSEKTDGKVFLSTSTPVGTTGIPLIVKNDLSFFHEARIEGLASSTTYYYTLFSTDASGNTTFQQNNTFTTRAR